MRVLGLHFAGRGYCVLPYIISQLSYIYIIYMSTLLFLCVSEKGVWMDVCVLLSEMTRRISKEKTSIQTSFK